MKITVHLRSGKSFEQDNVYLEEDLTRIKIVEDSGCYSVVPLSAIDWYDVEEF